MKLSALTQFLRQTLKNVPIKQRASIDKQKVIQCLYVIGEQ